MQSRTNSNLSGSQLTVTVINGPLRTPFRGPSRTPSGPPPGPLPILGIYYSKFLNLFFPRKSSLKTYCNKPMKMGFITVSFWTYFSRGKRFKTYCNKFVVGPPKRPLGSGIQRLGNGPFITVTVSWEPLNYRHLGYPWKGRGTRQHYWAVPNLLLL